MELKVLAKKIRGSGFFHDRIDQAHLLDFIKTELSLENNPFERLNANWSDFRRYCVKRWDDLTLWLKKGRGLTTASIADQFIADSMGYSDPKSARKAISRLRHSRNS